MLRSLCFLSWGVHLPSYKYALENIRHEGGGLTEFLPDLGKEWRGWLELCDLRATVGRAMPATADETAPSRKFRCVGRRELGGNRVRDMAVEGRQDRGHAEQPHAIKNLGLQCGLRGVPGRSERAGPCAYVSEPVPCEVGLANFDKFLIC